MSEKRPDYLAIVANEERRRSTNKEIRETAVLLGQKLHATVSAMGPDVTVAELLQATEALHLSYEVIEAIGDRF